LHDRPDDRHHQQRVLGLDAVGDEADDDCRDREEQEERRADIAELLRCQAEIPGEGNGRQSHDDLVGEVDQHEEEEQGGHAPGPFEWAIVDGHVDVSPRRPVGRTRISI